MDERELKKEMGLEDRGLVTYSREKPLMWYGYMAVGGRRGQ